MSNTDKRSRIPDAPAPAAATGNLLSSVAPPLELPNFITAPSASVVVSFGRLKKNMYLLTRHLLATVEIHIIPCKYLLTLLVFWDKQIHSFIHFIA